MFSQQYEITNCRTFPLYRPERKCAENYNKWHCKFIFQTAIGILLISNHNSFRVLFDKIASVYFLWKIHLYFSVGNGQPREPALRQLYRRTFVPQSPCPGVASALLGATESIASRVIIYIYIYTHTHTIIQRTQLHAAFLGCQFTIDDRALSYPAVSRRTNWSKAVFTPRPESQLDATATCGAARNLRRERNLSCSPSLATFKLFWKRDVHRFICFIVAILGLYCALLRTS